MKLLKYLLIGLLWCAIALAMPGCRTQSKFNKIAAKHPLWLAEACAERFPIDTNTRTNTVYVKADNPDLTKEYVELQKVADSLRNKVKTDTIYSEKECNDLLQSQQRKINNLSASIAGFKYKKCEPDTLFITTTYTVKDNRDLFKAQKHSRELEKVNDRLEQKNKNKNTAIWILSGICLVLGGLWAVRMFR